MLKPRPQTLFFFFRKCYVYWFLCCLPTVLAASSEVCSLFCFRSGSLNYDVAVESFCSGTRKFATGEVSGALASRLWQTPNKTTGCRTCPAPSRVTCLGESALCSLLPARLRCFPAQPRSRRFDVTSRGNACSSTRLG